MRVFHITAVLLFALFVLPAQAAGIRPGAPQSGVALNANDARMMQDAIKQALDQGKDGAASAWSDDASGLAGRATVTRVYAQGAQPCGTVEHVFTKGGGKRYTLPFCRQPDGSWKIQY